MNSSTIDVIIPVFNGEKYVSEAIKSVQSQTHSISRIIVCDDGSTDMTCAIVKGFIKNDQRITLLSLEHNGVSSARNSGIAESNSDLIAFLDADDIWLPNKIELQHQVLESSSIDVGFVHSSYFNIDADGNELKNAPVTPPKSHGDIFLPLLMEQYVLSGSASSVLVRRSVLDKAGYFDRRLFYGEDWDLWLRLAKKSKISFTPEAVVGIRVHTESAQRKRRPDQTLQFFQQHMIIYSKWSDIIYNSKGFIQNLRQQAIFSILPMLKGKPKEIVRFYDYLSTTQDTVARSLFSGPLDFTKELSLAVIRIIYIRLRKFLGIKQPE